MSQPRLPAPPAATAEQPVTLRLATPADAARLAELAARLFRATYAPPDGASRAEDVAVYVAGAFGPALQQAELADAALCTLLAERDGVPVGYAQLRRDSAPEHAPDFAWLRDAPGVTTGVAHADDGRGPRWTELARLYVDRAWHGRGVAGALLDAACARAQHDGAARVWLAVYQANARAVAFYRRAGFRPVATASFQMGAERQADWIMARALGGVAGEARRP